MLLPKYPPSVILSGEEFHRKAVKWNGVELLRVEDAIFRNSLRNGAPQQAKAQARRARSGICEGAFQRLLSLCNIFKVIPNQLHSNVTWCRQACHKPFGDPFLVKSLRDFPRQVLDRLAATVPLPLQNFDSVSFHRFAVKFSSAQDDTRGRTDRSKARKSPAN